MDHEPSIWQVYPGHIIRELRKHKGQDTISSRSRYIDIHEEGLIAYSIPKPEDRVTIWNSIKSLPSVNLRRSRSKSWGWSPSSTLIDWLPIYTQPVTQYVNPAGFPCQGDFLNFLVNGDDVGFIISIVVLQHIRDYRDEYNLKYFEDTIGEELREDMRADRVRVWFRALRRRPSKEGWKGLEDTLVRWLKYSQETPPPVGGARAINELKIVDMGEKKKGMYCELDLTDTRQETVEAMLAMVATYSETVFPLDYIFFA